MKVPKELKKIVVTEIARLGKILFDGDYKSKEFASLAGYSVNKLAYLLTGQISVDDFHDAMAGSPEETRQYYYNLLHIEKK